MGRFFLLVWVWLIASFHSTLAQVALAYDTGKEPLVYGAQLLGQEMVENGESFQTFHLQNLQELPSIIHLNPLDIPELLQPFVQKDDFGSILEEGYRIKWINDRNTLAILSTDEVGGLYGFMDLLEYFRANGDYGNIPEKSVNPALEYRIIKFNLPWSPYRDNPATTVHMSACRDLGFWEKFLDMMVENRFNVLSLWNNHPFPYMIRAKNFPEAGPLDETEMAEWKEFWTRLFRMAKQRGIQTFIVNWNIVVSPEFAETYGAQEYNDLSEKVIQYTRESVTQVIDEYPDLTGLGVTLADWMGTFDDKMTPVEREDWIEKTFVQGMKEAGRKVKFIHRSVLAGDPVAMRELLDRTEMDGPALVEVKFNWSHGHSTPKLAITHDYHSGELDERFWKPTPENYRIQWMVRNEDFFILRWGQPDFVKEHILTNNEDFVNGYFIGSEGYIPAMDYSHKPSPVKTWQYAFEKQWLFYKVWGRLLYQPDISYDVFRDAFDRRYGKGLGEGLLAAHQLAGNMPLRLASFYRSTWDYTLYSEGFLAAEPSNRDGYFDRSSPFISIDELIYHETLDPAMVSIPDYVTSMLKDKTILDGQIGPLDLADLLEKDSQEALKLLEKVRPRVNGFSGALLSEVEDIATWCYLGLYFGDKLRGGVALEYFRKTGDNSKKEEAVQYLEKCLEHWDQVIHYTKDRYMPTPHVSTEHYGLEFTEFSWEMFRSEVERDISIAKEASADAD